MRYRGTFKIVCHCAAAALVVSGCRGSNTNHPTSQDARLGGTDMSSAAGPDGSLDLPVTPGDTGSGDRSDSSSPDASPTFDPTACAGAMQVVYASQPNELIPGAGDLALKSGELFVGHSSSNYSWVFSIPEVGGGKNLLYEGHVLTWWLEDDRLIYAQPYDLFSMPQLGGPPISILHYGDKVYDQLGGLSLDDRNLDRDAIYWLFFGNDITIRRHLRNGGDDIVLATLAAADVSGRVDLSMVQSKDKLLVNFWDDTRGAYVATISKSGGTLQSLPVPAGKSKLLATSNGGGMLWSTLSYSPAASYSFMYATVDGTNPSPFPTDLPASTQPIHAWAAGNMAWYIAASEKDAQGALYLSIWYVESTGKSRRLACDPRGHAPSLGESKPAPVATITAGVAGDGRFYVSISYPEGNWIVARLDNPGASPDLANASPNVDGGVGGADAGSSPDGRGTSCPAVTGDGSVQGEAGQNGFTEFPVPTAGSVPQSIIAGPDGNVWFSEIQANKLGKITAAGCVTEYHLEHWANGLVSGPDGNLWFTQPSAGLVAHIATDGLLYRPFDIPGVTSPQEMTLGPDGNLWFADNGGSQIGRITPGGTATLFAPPSKLSVPVHIAASADGLVWFYEPNWSKLTSIDPNTGAMNEIAIPNAGTAGVLVAGPDGAVWFVNVRTAATSISRINADGTLTDLPFPSGRGPIAMASGPDGNLWIVEHDANAIARLSITTGAISEFTIPTPASDPSGITAGPDGNIWFTEGHVNQIGRLTP